MEIRNALSMKNYLEKPHTLFFGIFVFLSQTSLGRHLLLMQLHINCVLHDIKSSLPECYPVPVDRSSISYLPIANLGSVSLTSG
jgi:hypothetical protein